jgi:3-deoxy-7-phosphoheptulonate synthase
MTINTADLRITAACPLITPAVLARELPLNQAGAALIREARNTTARIMAGDDPRLLVIVGPCSIHDVAAARDYATRFRAGMERFADALFPVMRVYFEKPRTVVGWKGLINDPDLDGSFQINRGLHLARQLLLDITALGLPVASEFLDTTFGQYYAELVSFGAIGARTVESQIHRELASGLSMPVGIKNRTDGNIEVAIDALRAVRHPHWFPSLTREGTPAVFQSSGNDQTCLILRGGKVSGPNYTSESVQYIGGLLQKAGLADTLIIDCSHGNSGADPERQEAVVQSVIHQIDAGNHSIRGIMMESHLMGGRQVLTPGKTPVYGQSITDGCLALDQTLVLLEQLADAVRDVKKK